MYDRIRFGPTCIIIDENERYLLQSSDFGSGPTIYIAIRSKGYPAPIDISLAFAVLDGALHEAYCWHLAQEIFIFRFIPGQ